jgi:hypothetical protein
MINYSTFTIPQRYFKERPSRMFTARLEDEIVFTSTFCFFSILFAV